MKTNIKIIEESTEFDRARAVCKKISHQRPAGNHATLVFAVFRQVVLDSFGRHGEPKPDHDEARSYLRRLPIAHLELLGIDSVWARDLFKMANTRIMQ